MSERGTSTRKKGERRSGLLCLITLLFFQFFEIIINTYLEEEEKEREEIFVSELH